MSIKNFVGGVVAWGLLGCGGAAVAPESPSGAGPSAGEITAEPSIAVTPEMGSPHVGDDAPDFDLPDQNGTKLKLSSLRGNVVVIAFVTSWCPFSEAEQPYLSALADSYKGKNVRVVAVDFKEPDAGYKKYLGRVAMTIPVLNDADGTVAASYTPPRAQPNLKDRDKVIVTSNLVVDQNGKVQLFTMADTVHFDAKLVHVRRKVDGLLASAPAKP